jgi:DNA-binding Xre family transcriptional regulator
MDRQSSGDDTPGMGKPPKKRNVVVGKAPPPPPQPDQDVLHLGGWIKILGAKQKDVAKAGGIGESYLSLLISGEKDDPSGRILYRISEYLGVTVNDLYQPPPPPSQVEKLGRVPPRLWSALLELQAMRTRKDD